MSELTIKFSGLTRRQLITILAGILLSMTLAVAAIFYIREYTTLAGLPKTAYENLTFPVFFPRHPPIGFTLDRASISSTSQVLTYAYNYQGSNPVSVSIQPLDPKLDISSFNATREIATPIGRGYLVEYDTRVTVAIVTNKSLILLNSQDHIPSSAVEQLADSLASAK